MREVLLGSDTFKDPFDGDKDEEDSYDREQRRKQAHETHARRTFAIDQPDQTHSNDKE